MHVFSPVALVFVEFRLIRPKETPSREEMMEYWIMPIFDF